MLSTTTAGPLVSGSTQEPNDMAQPANIPTRRVKVMRAFYYKSEPIPVGAIVDLPVIFAKEMCAANKAVFVKDEPLESVPVLPESEPEPEKTKPQTGGRRHAT